ncbi:ubiquinol-cytochrome-c reductase complex subunit 6 [Lentinula boryana]|uniref:Cytochrome b-c1 complex subunit 7 n=1 Tax=Lentinula boryana TaxID=40481 RepID=A0ABQ8Q8N2_9AGAR|nr:ubiquinol-cytochrome-c reductase complex subunit 6 [Lentinula boryana]
MPLGFTLAPKVLASKTLTSWITPVAHWYANLAGYRRYGLKYDDLVIEEYEDVQKALNRLTPREQYDRAFRMKRASHASVLHNVLPKEEWTKPEEVSNPLSPADQM